MIIADGSAPRPRTRGHLGRAEIAIAARGVSRVREASRGPQSVLEEVSLDIVAGQLTVLTGPPESGKGALLRLLGGLERPDRGVVWIGPRRIGPGAGPPDCRFRRDQLTFIARPTGAAPREYRWAAIARALAPDPELVFIDEPAETLGRGGLDRLHASLHALTTISGRTAVLATGDAEVASWGERLVGLARGAVVRDLELPSAAEVHETVSALAAIPGRG